MEIGTCDRRGRTSELFTFFLLFILIPFQAAAVVRNQPIIQPNPMNPMVPMPSMGPMGLPQSPMVPPQSPIGPLPMSVGRPMASTNGMGEMMHPPEPSFPSIVWRRFNQVLDGFSNGFSSMADKVFKII